MVGKNMKLIRNDSLQAKILYFSSEIGPKEVWLKPSESIQVPDTYITEQVKTLQRRRALTISNI